MFEKLQHYYLKPLKQDLNSDSKPPEFLSIKKIDHPEKSLRDVIEIQRLNALKDVIRKVNHILLHVKKEKELYQRICEVLMKSGNYLLVWIGLFDFKNSDINFIAYSGLDEGYLSLIKSSLKKPQKIKYPAVLTIETGKVILTKNINTNPSYKPYRNEAEKRGYKSAISIPLLHSKKVIGSLNIYTGTNNCFKNSEIKILKEVANDITIGIRSLRYKNELESNYFKFKKALYETIDAIAMISERRDPYTAGHQKRVAMLASAIAKEMQLSEDMIEGIYLTSIIHDIGKMSVPLSILSKPTSLSKGETMLIQSHCQEAYNILKNIEFPWPVAEIILQHHERIDGSGYPNGLRDEEILLEAKILAVADTIEAMSSHRPYRPAIGLQKAIKEILKNKGKLYDSLTVDTCIDLFENKKFRFKD